MGASWRRYRLEDHRRCTVTCTEHVSTNDEDGSTLGPTNYVLRHVYGPTAWLDIDFTRG